MLQKLNERIQGMVAWIIILLLAITFLLFGIDSFMQSRHDTASQIEVNGYTITSNAFDSSYRRKKQQRLSSELSSNLEKQLKKQVFDELVLNSLSKQAALHNGFDVSTSLANAAIVNIPQFQKDGHFSENRYQQAISSAFFTPQTFQDEVRQGMLLNQQRFAFIGTSFALPSDINEFIQLHYQTRDYQYALFPSSRFVKTVSVSDDEINQYYAKHKDDFLTPELVSLSYVRLSKDNLKKTIKITPLQIANFYQDNQSLYTANGKTKPLAEVQSDIKQQLMSEAVQARFSDELERLSELSYQTPDSLTPASDELALAIEYTEAFSRQGGQSDLTKNPLIFQLAFSPDILAGNNSGAIQLDDDTALVVRVNDHIPAKRKSKDAVKSDIKKTVSLHKARLKAREFGEKLLNSSITSSELNTVEGKKSPWHKVLNASREMDNPIADEINQVAFGLSPNPGQGGEWLSNGNYVVIKLSKIKQGNLKSVDKEQLASISEQIEASLGRMEYDLYISGLLKTANVVKH